MRPQRQYTRRTGSGWASMQSARDHVSRAASKHGTPQQPLVTVACLPQVGLAPWLDRCERPREMRAMASIGVLGPTHRPLWLLNSELQNSHVESRRGV